jgi:nitroimidazol reductase NimA-like FMN-containing flavoprotein (pyridoxamine 5'-phosphate oxidase superfamily)
MKKKNQEITDKRIINEILTCSEICRIAMLDNDSPYILPVNYGYKDNIIYIHSAPEGKKIDLLKKNNKICFEIEQKAEIVKHEKPCKWATKYRSVIGYGEIEIVTDYEEKKKGLNIIMSHYGEHLNLDYSEKQVENIVILRLIISELTGKQSSNWIDD